MKRNLVVFWAHVQANAFALADALANMLAGNPEHIRPILLVYTRFSVENVRGYAKQMTRQVGVGYWTRPLHGQTSMWVDYRIYFLEKYNLETKTWRRVTSTPVPLNHLNQDQ